MKPIRILVDSFADAGFPNAQMGNAREIVSRLDPQRFHVSMFALGTVDPRIAQRPNTRLIRLPKHRQTPRIFSEFLWGPHSLLFYLKASPASRWYLNLRRKWRDQRIVVGTIEGQCDYKNEATISAEAVQLWERTILRCDHLYSNCSFVQRSLEREYGLSSGVIPTGADTHFFTPRWERPPNPRPCVLFVGSLCGRKQPEMLLSAAARFPDADFRIAGTGVMGLELKTQIERESLANVTLLGNLGAEQLREEYRNADIFFFPSHFEGSPKVIVEAAACGLPVIVRNNYSPETVINEITGYQAASDDELYSRLQALLASRESRLKLGHAGRLHSLKFDWSLITPQWEEAFVTFANATADRQAS